MGMLDLSKRRLRRLERILHMNLPAFKGLRRAAARVSHDRQLFDGAGCLQRGCAAERLDPRGTSVAAPVGCLELLTSHRKGRLVTCTLVA